MKKNYAVGNSQTRLNFTPDSKGAFGFAAEIKNSTWEPVSASANPLVRGSSLVLSPTTITPGKDSLRVTGVVQDQAFSGLISLLDDGWYSFFIEVQAKKNLPLSHQPFVEPAMMVELPSLSVQQEGGLIWEQSLVANPIVDAQGIQATDLPASYYYDPATETEWYFYLDWERLSWANNQNIFGFLGGQCGLHTWLERHPETPLRRRYFGFRGLNEDYSGKIFPKGTQTFQFYFRFQKGTKPTEWEANARLISAIGRFVKKTPHLKTKNYSWLTFSEECLNELIKKPHVAQVDFGSEGLGLRAYGEIGDFVSPNPPARVELMTQTDLLWPLFYWSKLGLPGYDKTFHARLRSLLPKFYDQTERFFGNWYPHEPNLLPQDQETWYFLENGLVKTGWLAILENDKHLKKRFLGFADRCQEIGCAYQYLFPLRYNWRLHQTSGSRKNYISGGLYAYGMSLAFKLSGRRVYLAEAEKALKTLRRLPLDLLNHEPQQTAFGAAAATCLYKETGNHEWETFSQQLIAHQLRMFYWYTDTTVLEALDCDTAGMARSFPSKIYPVIKHNPAFKENIESLLPWLYLINQSDPPLILLDFLNLARRNNFYFFDQYHGIRKNSSWVPLESLPALPESGKLHRGGGVGHAVYGAGEILWAALIFEAVAQAENRELMTATLHFFDFTARERNNPRIVIFNPTLKEITTSVQLRYSFQTGDQIYISNRPGKSVTLKKCISVTLKAREHAYIEKK